MNTRRLLLTAALAWGFSSALPAQQTAESPTIQQKLERIILPTVQFQNATIEEALEYLRVKSREIDKDNNPPTSNGVSFVLKTDAPKAATISLDLKDVPLGVVLGYCVELAGLKYRVDAHAVMIAVSLDPKFAPPLLGNAEAIIFPTVQFSGATLEEAAEFFRVKSRMLDTAKKGVNILVKRGGTDARVTLDLRDIPLSHALGYMAEVGQCKLTTDSHSYILTPKQAK